MCSDKRFENLTSSKIMKDNGWNFTNLQTGGYDSRCNDETWYGYRSTNASDAPSEVSMTFENNSSATLEFENCGFGPDGIVNAYVNEILQDSAHFGSF